MSYSYPTAPNITFEARDTAPLGSADREIRGLYHHREFVAIQAAFDGLPTTYLSINNPTFTGTMTGGVIDGGSF